MLSPIQINEIVNRIHSLPGLHGVPIGHYTGFQCRIAHPGYPFSNSDNVLAIIIEELHTPFYANTTSKSSFEPELSHQPPAVLNRSRVGAELRGASLNCGLTVLSGIGVAGAAATELPTAGMSTALLVVAWTGMISSGVQCLNGVVRTVEAWRQPDSASLHDWDHEAVYSTLMSVVDGIAVGSSVVSLPSATRNLFSVMSRNNLIQRSASDFSNMNRFERAAEIQKAVKMAGSDPRKADALSKALAEVHIANRTMARNSLSVRNADAASKVINEQMMRQLNQSIKETLTLSATPIVSALPKNLVGNASGVVNRAGGVIIHVVAGQ